MQVCDSDTVLDPACTIELLKVLEEDPNVGGVGGDVQVRKVCRENSTISQFAKLMTHEKFYIKHYDSKTSYSNSNPTFLIYFRS